MPNSYDGSGTSPTSSSSNPFDSLQSQPDWVQLQSNPSQISQHQTPTDVFACNTVIDQLPSIEESFAEFVSTPRVSTFASNFAEEEELTLSNPLKAASSQLNFNRLPDSDQYIANLEKRIAKLKNRKVLVQPERVRGTGQNGGLSQPIK